MATALNVWHLRGGRVLMVTSTMRHSRAERLADLMAGLGAAWTAVRQDKAFRALYGATCDGWIKRLDITVGKNGWHPHLHTLFFLRPGTTDADALALGNGLFKPWAGRLVKLGLGEPTEENGVDVKLLTLDQAHEQVARYVATTEYAAAGALGAALEMTTTDTKRARNGNRTAMQLLADVVRFGLASDHALWREYEETTRGKRTMQWSHHLRRNLMGNLPEITDEEAAEESDGAARTLGVLARDTWREIRAVAGRPARVLEWAELLVEDDDQARQLVNVLLAQHGHGPLLSLDALDRSVVDAGDGVIPSTEAVRMGRYGEVRGEDADGAGVRGVEGGDLQGRAGDGVRLSVDDRQPSDRPRDHAGGIRRVVE
jgi:hypothetical protein